MSTSPWQIVSLPAKRLGRRLPFKTRRRRRRVIPVTVVKPIVRKMSLLLLLVMNRVFFLLLPVGFLVLRTWAPQMTVLRKSSIRRKRCRLILNVRPVLLMTPLILNVPFSVKLFRRRKFVWRMTLRRRLLTGLKFLFQKLRLLPVAV